jgi:hypothetical protein
MIDKLILDHLNEILFFEYRKNPEITITVDRIMIHVLVKCRC